MLWSNWTWAPQLLNLRAATTEAHAPRARALQKKSHLSEKTAPEASVLQLEKAPTQQQRPRASKKK